jgi:ATP-dependent Zn protease
MSAYLKNAIFWAVIILVALLLWAVVKRDPRPPAPTITWSRFSEEAKNSNIAEITIAPNDWIIGRLKNGTTFKTVAVAAPYYRDTVDRLMEQGVSVSFLPKDAPVWTNLIINATPFILLLAFWLFMMRRIGKTTKATPPS